MKIPAATLFGFRPGSTAPLSATTISPVLRLGLGLVLLSGGASKLSQLLDPERQAAILTSYLGAAGYVNQFFAEFLFGEPTGGALSPFFFLTALSTFEFMTGALLIVGLLVRPLALVWALLFWSFVVALPVVTAPGAHIDVPTHTTPALLVLIRDIGLSGLFVVLFNVGPGSASLDRRLFGSKATLPMVNWNMLGLILRLSIALPLLVGAVFAGAPHIQTYGMPALLLGVLAMALVLNVYTRGAAVLVLGVLGWFLLSRIEPSASILALFNAVKREFAFAAAAAVLVRHGGGDHFSAGKIRGWWSWLMFREGSSPGVVPAITASEATY